MPEARKSNPLPEQLNAHRFIFFWKFLIKTGIFLSLKVSKQENWREY
jgi:hypothetical protein